MTRTDEHLKRLDDVEVRADWDRVRYRTPDPSLDTNATLQLDDDGSSSRSGRIALIAAALVIGLAGTVALAVAFRDHTENVATGPTAAGVKITLGQGANSGATLTTGTVSVPGVRVSVIVPDEGASGNSPFSYHDRSIRSALGVSSFSIDTKPLATAELSPVSVSSDTLVSSDPTDMALFAFSTDQSAGAPVDWSQLPAGKAR